MTATRKRGLGRGLDALLGGAPAAPGRETAVDDGELRQLPVDVIRRGKYQPRSVIQAERLEELADSIRAQGVVQPIVVRPVGDGQYEIIAGERRWRAAQQAGLHEVPAVVRRVEDQAAMAMALIENIQRENLNPMEEAVALQRLITEFELTHQMAAEAVGRSRAAVTNLLRLFELNEDVKSLLEAGELEMGHARALLGLSGALQSEAARKVVARGLSVRETEQLVRRLQKPAPSRASGRVATDPDVLKLQEDLSQRLGAAVSFQQGARGRGKLIIHYNNLDELEGILAHIK
ncbi:MAG TPA: ParB/RepB/Spo0J family partition protein [Chromatiales bacterium]|nr:ParB/RepB/Spo0J family partition protein [Chromatiales bacterium]